MKHSPARRFCFTLWVLFFLSPAVNGILPLSGNRLDATRARTLSEFPFANHAFAQGGDAEDPQLSFAEAIRSSRPEKLFDLLKDGAAPLPRNRELFMRGFAWYRTGDFEKAERLVSGMSRDSADTALLQSLLLASRGRFEEAEKHARYAFDHRAQLGPFFFESGLQLSYVLQHLRRHRDAAPVIEAIVPEAPQSRPVLRCIAASLGAAPPDPYEKQQRNGNETIPLLADGSIPPRTVMSIYEGDQPALVLFDTGTSITFLKTDNPAEGCAMAMALDPTSNVNFYYGWKPRLDLGNWRIGNVPVGFAARQSAGMQYEALFGLALMRQFFVVFDFPKRSMQLLARAPDKVEGDSVEFRYVADQLIIPALIHNRRANVLLDTGLAMPSIKLDISWGDKLSEPVRKDASSVKARKSKPAPKSSAVELSVKSLKFGRQELKDLSISFESLQRRLQQTPLATRIDAILPAPLVKQYVVSIDFEKNRIYFK